MEQSTKAYEPGTVAVATVRGVKGVRVVRRDGWWYDPGGPRQIAEDGDVTDIRPLMVLDLDGHDVAPNLEDIRKAVDEYDTRLGPGSARDLFEAIADQIEAQIRPPRIPEPGLWGVVEATVTFEGTTYSTSLVRHPGPGAAKCWLGQSGSWFAWSDLIDPTLIREGVES